jgi:fumarate hydratase subunit beta
LIEKGEDLPFDLPGQVIFYVGPSPAKPGFAVGSAGPTTSYRMDAYAPLLIENGLKGMIGKGPRGDNVKQAMKKHGAVYFAAIGGAGALISKSITAAEVIAYPELGAEAIRRMEVKDFPAIVAIDTLGNDLFIKGKEAYKARA